tara:strand:+ start:8524 stop:9192 length:669 start_codon:yes stop_codon:yes gene_type:complete
MAISINGSTGISGVDGSTSSPSLRGSDADTGISFGSNTAAISTDGVQRIHVDNNGKVILASNTDINGNMGFTGDMGVTGDVGVTGATTFTGAMTVTGNSGFTGAMTVTGNSGFTGDLDLNGKYVTNIVAMSALDVDCSAGNYFTKTINGASTFTFSNVPSNKSFSFTLEVTHNSGSITWPSSVKFPADTAPTLNTSKTHLFVFVTDDGGSRWRGNAVVDFTN